MLEKLHEIYGVFANYAIVGITDDGGELCEKCLKENADLIHESYKGDGWHVIALEFDEGDGFLCDHCGEDTTFHDSDDTDA